MSALKISLKRAYLTAAPEDGLRILVERLWPRGLTQDKAAIVHWLKDIAPTPELRKWYGHEPERWPEFQTRYRAELAENRREIGALRDLCDNQQVTFVFAAKEKTRRATARLC